jgi:hypothetical protein
MFGKLPKIDVDKLRAALSPDDFDIARRIVATRGKNKGRLRATFPRTREVVDNPTVGRARYLWRMTAFGWSPDHKHQCMPVMADMDLPVPTGLSTPEWRETRRNEIARMREIEKVVDVVIRETEPGTRPHGALRWASVLGPVVPLS